MRSANRGYHGLAVDAADAETPGDVMADTSKGEPLLGSSADQGFQRSRSVSRTRSAAGSLIDDALSFVEVGRQTPASFEATTINIITGGLGAGILSLPWAVAGSSIINGLILNALVLGLNSWTIMLLIHAGEW
jgi:hypothetical protein